MTKFLADECIFKLTIEFLKNMGWDVVTVREIGLQGAKDSEVINKAKEMKAILITQDMDFCDIGKFPPPAYAGIIVLKMTYYNLDRVHVTLQRMLSEVQENEFSGALFIVDHNKWRKRKRGLSSSGF